jgi:hypothetical protein
MISSMRPAPRTVAAGILRLLRSSNKFRKGLALGGSKERKRLPIEFSWEIDAYGGNPARGGTIPNPAAPEQWHQ